MEYKMADGSTTFRDDKGNMIPVANFEARIIEEHKYVDGLKLERYYLIEGIVGGKKEPQITVQSTDFATLNWPASAWGSQAIIFPRPGAKENLRTAIQIESKPKIRTIYTHTGWTKIKGEDVYLTNNCAIGKKARKTDINVELPADLSQFSFPTKSVGQANAILASLNIAKMLPTNIGWPLLAATYRAAISPCDFSLHITGRTGTYKSEIASIIQSHWGLCTARELPASWSSTANALEALAYRAKNAILVCDDFIPTGTSWQVKSYQKTADQVIRAQGNQAGRARLTDKSLLQKTMYPRGLIISTGEDTPEGHSVRARMMITEISPGDIDTKNLTTMQNARAIYSEAMASFIEWLAQDLKAKIKMTQETATEIRDSNLSIGHSRTPPTLGELAAGILLFLSFAGETKAITMREADRYYKTALEALKSLAGQQSEYLTAADPADQFISIMRGILAATAGHIKAKNGGIPKKALLLGWTAIGDGLDVEYKPHGPRLGWADDREKIIYLDATVAYDTIRRHSRGAITITRQTLYKRLREAGFLAKVDDTRQRNTIRVQLEDASRQVLAIQMAQITEGED